MDITYDSSLNTTQRQWFENAVAGFSYPLGSISTSVLVEAVTEPSCTGHKDLMCTHSDGSGGWIIEIRNGIENADNPYNAWLPPDTNLQSFFEESAAHEIGHVISFVIADTVGEKTALAELFYYDRTGDRRQGTAGDWNDTSKPWADRIQEAVAEALKDTFFHDRVFDNRTNWTLSEADHKTLLSLLGGDVGPAGGGTLSPTITNSGPDLSVYTGYPQYPCGTPDRNWTGHVMVPVGGGRGRILMTVDEEAVGWAISSALFINARANGYEWLPDRMLLGEDISVWASLYEAKFDFFQYSGFSGVVNYFGRFNTPQSTAGHTDYANSNYRHQAYSQYLAQSDGLVTYSSDHVYDLPEQLDIYVGPSSPGAGVYNYACDYILHNLEVVITKVESPEFPYAADLSAGQGPTGVQRLTRG